MSRIDYTLPNIGRPVIDARSGTVVINDGEIKAKGGASVFSVDKNVDITINAGKFSLHRNDNLLCGLDKGFDAPTYRVQTDTTFGSLGISNRAFKKPSMTWIEYNAGKESGKCTALSSDWSTAFSKYVANKSEVRDLEPYIIVYPDGSLGKLNAVADVTNAEVPALDPSVPGNLVFEPQDYVSPFCFIPAETYDRTDETVWKRQFSYSIYDVTEGVANAKALEFSSGHTAATKETTNKDSYNGQIDLADYPYLVKGLQLGRTYLLLCEIKEVYYGQRTYNTASGYSRYFTTDSIAAPEVITQPKNTTASSKGDQVTLTAKAVGAVDASWIEIRKSGSLHRFCTNPEDERFSMEEIDGKLKSVYTAEITVDADRTSQFYCVFSNSTGRTESEKATVSFIPEFKKTEFESLTMFDGYTFKLNQPINLELPDENVTVNWYFTTSLVLLRNFNSDRSYLSEFRNLTTRPLHPAGKGGIEFTSVNLTSINNTTLEITPSKACDGYYLCELTVKTPDGIQKIYSPYARVNYSDEAPERYITSLELTGIGDLCIGDRAPTISDIKCDDPRVEIAKFEWIRGVYNGYIQTPYPAYTITVNVKTGNDFRFKNTDDKFIWTMDGSPRTTKVNIPFSMELLYEYNNYNALETPKDEVNFDETSFILRNGDDVDITLGVEVVTNPRFEAIGETHTLSSIRVTNPKNSPLPEGLSLVKEGNAYHVKGTLTNAPGIVKTSLTVDISNGDEGGTLLTFYVRDNAEDSQAAVEEKASEMHTVQRFSAWKPDPENALQHVRFCEDCGYEDHEKHDLDEGVIITEATKDSQGTKRYTCLDCGYTVDLKYDWEPSTVCLTIDMNDGDSTHVMSIEFKEGDNFELPGVSEDYASTPEGKVFDGWDKGAKGTIITVDEDMTIVAQWKDKTAGTTLSGTVTSFGDTADVVTLQLIKAGTTEAAYETTADGSGSYRIASVSAGTYTLRVSKKNHVSEEVAVTIAGTDVTKDVAIYLLGDVNMDGTVNVMDMTLLKRYVSNESKYPLTSDQLKHADVNGDRNINIMDFTLLKRYISNPSKYPLYS